MTERQLKPQWFQILLALRAQGPLHGYAIQRSVLERTEGQMRLWPATLYRSLSKLVESGLLQQLDTPADESVDERRQYYGITPEGVARLEEQVAMMARWVDTARRAADA